MSEQPVWQRAADLIPSIDGVDVVGHVANGGPLRLQQLQHRLDGGLGPRGAREEGDEGRHVVGGADVRGRVVPARFTIVVPQRNAVLRLVLEGRKGAARGRIGVLVEADGVVGHAHPGPVGVEASPPDAVVPVDSHALVVGVFEVKGVLLVCQGAPSLRFRGGPVAGLELIGRQVRVPSSVAFGSSEADGCLAQHGANQSTKWGGAEKSSADQSL